MFRVADVAEKTPQSFGSRFAHADGPTRFPGSPRLHRWLRILLIVIVACLALDYGLSLFLEFGGLNHALTRRIEAAFGRPVEISHYSFSLLEGPRLEADRITVAEDPRFGNEYFLRADALAIGLRWGALLRGHLEFGPLSLTRPSLNLVRLPDGEWNLESWLPRPRGNLAAAPAPGRASLRLQRIDLSGGRVDFKESDAKLPFALANVEGSVEQVSPGTWRIDLQAQPFRAAAVVQQAGVLSLTGLVGGTSSRLRPASFELDWAGASLSDVLRLLRGTDYGVRGVFSLQLAAKTVGEDWNFSSHAQFRRLHRWDLPLRPDDPAANLDLVTRWLPAQSRFELTQAVLEAPRSNIHATGAMNWIAAPDAMHVAVKNAQLEIVSDSVGMPDALAWYRAFHRDVAEQLALTGTAMMHVTLSGWPPRVQKGIVASDGIELDGGSARVPIRLGSASLLFTSDSISLRPAIFSIGVRSGEFRVRGSASRLPRWHSAWKLDGQTTEVRTLVGAAGALGFSLPPGWLIDGPAQFHLQWQDAASSSHLSASAPRLSPSLIFRHPQGTITLAGVTVGAPFLNREITHLSGTVNFPSELKGGGVRVQLTSASVFAASWRGTLQRQAGDPEWQFALSANALDAAEMDRWLNPQRRESLLDRILPFLASKPQPGPVPAWLRGHGSVSVGEFALAPFRLRQFTADAAVEGRELALTNAHAEFYGGELLGSIALNLAAEPAYDVTAKFTDVNLSSLAAQTLSLSDLLAGAASGGLQISAKGIGRAALLGSLTCHGDARIRGASFNGIDLDESFRAGARRPGISNFPAASADFSCANGQVRFSSLHLETQNESYNATGHVDFNRQVNLEFSPLAAGNVPDLAAVSDPPDKNSPAIFTLTGSLKSPTLRRITPTSSH
ncbi:MAG TPA: AsmA family protein [Candidatus Acidoferrales bacterium]|nr:AsmA family protein [Candidatus Acidoferrales bacterium]